MNRKGMEMAISTLVIIIIAVVVLTILVIGFSTGWSKMFGKITSFDDPNDEKLAKCNVDCAQGDQASFDVEGCRAVGVECTFAG